MVNKKSLKKTNKTLPGKSEKFTQKQIMDALTKSGGYVTVAAKSLKCHYTTIMNYIKKYPKVRDCYDQIRESYLDLAEHTLITKIKEKETVATLFYLKCKGKKRGYVERQEITGADGKDFLTFADLARKASE